MTGVVLRSVIAVIIMNMMGPALTLFMLLVVFVLIAVLVIVFIAAIMVFFIGVTIAGTDRQSREYQNKQYSVE